MQYIIDSNLNYHGWTELLRNYGSILHTTLDTRALNEHSVLYVHATDFDNYISEKESTNSNISNMLHELATLGTLVNCQIIIYSGDYTKLHKSKGKYLDAIKAYGIISDNLIGDMCFFPDIDMTNASDYFKAFIDARNLNPEVLASSFLTSQREFLVVTLSLLLQAYVKYSNTGIFDQSYWKPVCTNDGYLDPQVSSWLQDNNLDFLMTDKLVNQLKPINIKKIKKYYGID